VRGVALALALVAVGCGGDNGSSPRDMSVVHDLYSICGHPGDVGNSLGVGKYCTKLTDCSSNVKATLCTTLGSDDSFFCTFACSGNSDLGGECGEAASCQCQGGQCGCFPDSCRE
jgi:hypothetical protein